MPLAVELAKEADGRWRALVPTMPEITAHGATEEEARDRARSRAAQLLAERADITRKGEWYFAHSPEIDVSNQGETVEEARQGLREALEFYLSDD
jgi:predicted RNase H-like HicB family nuclease